MGLWNGIGNGIGRKKSGINWSSYWATHRAIGNYPAQEAEPMSAPTIYVDSSATGAANGSSWANAYTTILAAHSAASAGAVIEVSGGVAGKTYTDHLDITKAVTIQGSRESGHDGLVTHTGFIYSHNTSGIIKIINIKHTFLINSQPFYAYADSNIEFYDCTLGPYITSNKSATLVGGRIYHKNCELLLRYRTSDAGRYLFVATGVATVIFEYCTLKHSGFLVLASASTLYCRNVTVVDTFGISSWYTPPVANTTTLINVAFVGCHPLITTALTTPPIVKNCFWNKRPLITGAANDTVYFDTANIATKTDCIDHVIPYFTDPKDSFGGYLGIRYDDRVRLETSLSVAEVLNPEIKITHHVDIHGGCAGTRPTARQIDIMRTLIAAGNEIADHSSTHSDSSDLGIINISATGTSPTLDITVTQAGDSTTWTGTLTITINGTAQNYDLTTYKTIGALLTAINGDSIGDGVVTAVKNNSAHSDSILSCCLDEVTAQSISALYEINLDDDAFLRFEITESILDLEAYINTGEDRNGDNAVAGTTVAAPAIPYVCKMFGSAYARRRASLITLLQNNANIAGADIGFNTMFTIYAQSLYTGGYFQMTDTNMEEDLFALCAAAATGSMIYVPVFHGYIPTFNGTVAGFKSLCQSFGVGDKTLSEIVEYLRSDGGWTVTEPNIAFTGDYDDYLYKGDFSLLANSPLWGTGTLDIV